MAIFYIYVSVYIYMCIYIYIYMVHFYELLNGLKISVTLNNQFLLLTFLLSTPITVIRKF